MSEFNGKEYYGYALRKDPELSTTTRNFEFKYNRPELLDRVIEKVQRADVGVQMTPKKTSKPSVTRKANIKGRYLPEGDVGTHMSCNHGGQTRLLTEDEVELLIYKAKSSGVLNHDSNKTLCPASSETLKHASSKTLCPASVKVWLPFQEDECIKDAYLQKNSSQEAVVVEKFHVPEAQWVEVIEKPKGILSLVDIGPTTQRNVINTETQIIDITDSVFCRNSVEIEGLKMNADGSICDYTNKQKFVVDSDLEYEMLSRDEYTKYCDPRPRLDDTLGSGENSDDSSKFFEVEIPEQPHKISFLKNKSPMRYSDMTSDREIDKQESGDGISKVHIISEKSATPDLDVKLLKSNHFGQVAKANKPSQSPAKTKKNPMRKPMSVPASPKKQELPLTNSARPLVAKSQSANITPHPSPRNNTFRSMRAAVKLGTPKRKKLILSKSMEALKTEKRHLFKKMHSTHERIICALDLLRNGLMLICMPRARNDKSRTLQNALDFSVRFCRNYLYPIRAVAEDLKSTSIESFNSASSNEACQRLANIYTMIWQALVQFHKQLRYFLVENVPQKLTALIECILKVTQTCLEKTVFVRTDPLIECLVDRCTKFLGFVETIQTERTQIARDQNRKTVLKKGHKDYELKMYMNHLNMYEPQLVPKNIPKRRTIAPKRKSKSKQNAAAVNSADFLMTNKAEDAISTHVQGLDPVASMDFSMQSILNDSLNDDNDGEHSGVTEALNKSIIEALQKVTKDQVRQVLEPILRALGSAIHEEQNSKTIEAILKAFQANRLVPGTKQHGLSDPTSSKDKVPSEKSNRVTSSTTAHQSATSESLSTASQTKSLPQRKSCEAAVNCYSDDDGNRCLDSGCGDHISLRRSSSDSSIGDNIRRYQHMERMLARDDECTGGAAKRATNAVIKSRRQQEKTLKQHAEDQQAELTREFKQLQQLQDDFNADISPHSQTATPKKKQSPQISFTQSSTSRRSTGTASSALRSQEARRLPPKAAARKEVVSKTSKSTRALPEQNRPRPQNARKKKRNILASPPPAPTITPNPSEFTGTDTDQTTNSSCSFKLDECTLADLGHIDYTKAPILLTGACQFQLPHQMPQNFVIGLGHFNSEGSVEQKRSRSKIGKNGQDVDCKTGSVQRSSNSSHQSASEQESSHVDQSTQVQKGGEVKDQAYYEGSEEKASHLQELQRKIDKQKAAEQELLQLKEEMYKQELHELQTLQMQLALKKQDQKEQKQRERSSPTDLKEEFPNNIGDSLKPQKEQTDPLQVSELIRERDHFVDLCKTNRFYTNPNFKDPWKIFSRISTYIVNEAIDAVEHDFSVGVTTFVEDFIQMETQTGIMD